MQRRSTVTQWYPETLCGSDNYVSPPNVLSSSNTNESISAATAIRMFCCSTAFAKAV
jgi:hypothetical protein